MRQFETVILTIGFLPRNTRSRHSLCRSHASLWPNSVTRRRFTSPSGSSGPWSNTTGPARIRASPIGRCRRSPGPQPQTHDPDVHGHRAHLAEELIQLVDKLMYDAKSQNAPHVHCAASGFGMAGWKRCRSTHRRGCFRGNSRRPRDLDRRGTPLDRQGTRPGVRPRALDRLR